MPSQNPKINQEKLESLVEFATILHQQNNYEEILRIVSFKISQLLNADLALILMLNPRTQQTVKTIFKEGQEYSHPRYAAIQTQISGWMMKYKQSLLSEDIKKDTRFKQMDWSSFPFVSVLGVPIQVEGQIIGSLILFNSQERFNSNDLFFLEKIIVFAAPYLRNVQKIQDYFKSPLPEAALLTKYEHMGMLGKSKPFIKLLQSIEAAARCDVRVLLQGENGTGKELVARAIHLLSDRKNNAFVAIDCGAIPDHLIESELFGHVRGAFTGALSDRKGLMAEANNGTFFMDEINNLPFDTQAKLLRVLQEGEVRSVGSNKSHKLNVRIITASSSSLQNLVNEQSFRKDLYYRLHVYPIYVPTLDERHNDIPLLANFFLERFAQQQGKKVSSFHGSLLKFMQKHHWTGNIRELENFVERLVTLASLETTELNKSVLPDEFQNEFKISAEQETKSATKTLGERMTEYEKEVIYRTLEENDWNQRKSARILGISEGALRYKMEKFAITRRAKFLP